MMKHYHHDFASDIFLILETVGATLLLGLHILQSTSSVIIYILLQSIQKEMRVKFQ
jgi:hypothetical protein